MSFLYSILLKVLYPTSLSLLFLGAAVALRKRKVPCRACFSIAVGILLLCGNGFILRALTKNLEWRNLPPNPVPQADCILVLSGGILPPTPPRPTVEVAEAGDRLLYGAHLFRHGKAPRIVCTGNVATGGIVARPVAEDMAEFLRDLAIPADAILTEIKSEDTHQHARNLYPVFQDRGYKRVLLVTSAMHMPRSLGVFRHLCPGIEFTPAPTDFRTVELPPMPWYRYLVFFIPTPRSLQDFSEITHEYLGIAWYRLRGWM